jgi:hypothetical protein
MPFSERTKRYGRALSNGLGAFCATLNKLESMDASFKSTPSTNRVPEDTHKEVSSSVPTVTTTAVPKPYQVSASDAPLQPEARYIPVLIGLKQPDFIDREERYLGWDRPTVVGEEGKVTYFMEDLTMRWGRCAKMRGEVHIFGYVKLEYDGSLDLSEADPASRIHGGYFIKPGSVIAKKGTTPFMIMAGCHKDDWKTLVRWVD